MTTIRAAYRQQRANAKDRGIKFEFEYDEWIRWWREHLGPYWFRKRGKGKFCMCRKNDTGSYRWDNVECLTHEENTQQAKGWHHTKKFRLWLSRKRRGKGNPFYGRKHSAKTRTKFKLRKPARLGAKHSFSFA